GSWPARCGCSPRSARADSPEARICMWPTPRGSVKPAAWPRGAWFARARVHGRNRRPNLMNRSLRLMLGLAAAASPGMAAQAHADPAGVKVGVLTCNVSSGWGLVFGSSRELNCSFSADSKHFENYVGKISKFGVDIGYEHAAIMAWAVFAPSADMKPGS